jgi:hypothetical protein
VSDPCSAWRPILLTKKEAAMLSDASARQVLAHNETGERLCGWKRNAPAAKASEPTH